MNLPMTNMKKNLTGELSAHCVGPHKVAYCELYDHGDGTFTLNVKPQEAGKHTLTVKYGGENMNFIKSQRKFRITQQVLKNNEIYKSIYIS